MRKIILFPVVFTLFFIFFPLAGHAMPERVRIGLERTLRSAESVFISNNHIQAGYQVNGQFSVYETLQSGGGFTAKINSAGQVALYSGNKAVYIFDDSAGAGQIRDADGGFISLGGNAYRGAAEFKKEGGRISVINVLTPEEYLYSVVPSEMSPSFHLEALKAQAVAARSYMLSHMGTHQGYDLCDQIHCQLYRGTSPEHENSTRAVDDTRGQGIYYQGEIINAVYFSSGGGSTDNSENVWTEPLPYLRSVADIAEHEPRDWERSFTWAEITNLLKNANANIGTANGMAITRMGMNGRVQELTVFGTNGKKIFVKEETRTFFLPAGGALDSRRFTINGAVFANPVVSVTDGINTRSVEINGLHVIDTKNAVSALQSASMYDGEKTFIPESASNTVSGGNGVTLRGSGWGHGVGMNQRGAEGMARLGYDYYAILRHYYTGVDIY